jgi:glycyl-tRNA synthetase beta chain
LSDARFFFETDKKTSLVQMNERLKLVVFEQQLGTVWEKAERISSLAAAIAQRMGEDASAAARAGLLAKADLASSMVGEFPELQGIMGRYYAKHDGETEAVELAIEEQYLPRHAGDRIPATHIGACIAIADKVDTLIGILGIGKHPTGDRDPFGLRRAALGLLRILVGRRYTIDLSWLADCSIENFADRLTNNQVKADFLDFVQGRYTSWLNDEGYATDTIRSVLAVQATVPFDFYQRVRAVHQFRKMPEALALAAANKRVVNILSKQASGSFTGVPSIDPALLQEKAERDLWEQVREQQSKLGVKGMDHEARLSSLAQLQTTVDYFFEQVLVNCEDQQVRQNRLGLLKSLSELFLSIADISQLQ